MEAIRKTYTVEILLRFDSKNEFNEFKEDLGDSLCGKNNVIDKLYITLKDM